MARRKFICGLSGWWAFLVVFALYFIWTLGFAWQALFRNVMSVESYRALVIGDATYHLKDVHSFVVLSSQNSSLSNLNSSEQLVRNKRKNSPTIGKWDQTNERSEQQKKQVSMPNVRSSAASEQLAKNKQNQEKAQFVNNQNQPFRQKVHLTRIINYRISRNLLRIPKQETSTQEDGSLISLVTQCSEDRINSILIQARVWLGPISLALYVDDKLEPRLNDFLANFSASLTEARGSTKAPFVVSLLYALKNASTYDSGYPTNALRNVAIHASTTDFIPSMNLYEDLSRLAIFKGGKSTLSKSNELTAKSEVESERLVYVVPVFALMKFTGFESLPRNFEEARSYYLRGKLKTFQVKQHIPTDYARWWKSNHSYDVRWEDPYEPYLVMHRAMIPKFDERFRGYGRNKIAFVAVLAAMGFRFRVLPKCFAYHLPHAHSSSRRSLNFVKIVVSSSDNSKVEMKF